jgi:hypothetical protein
MDSIEWIIDSGASSRMSMRKDWIEDWNYWRLEVTVVNKKRVCTEGTVDVTVKKNPMLLRQLRMFFVCQD